MSGLLAPEARMGNDIARQFAHLPHDEAVAGIAGHITAFWNPRMKAALAALVAAGEPDLDPLLPEVVDRLRIHPADPG